MAPQLFLDLVALVGGTVLTFGGGAHDEVHGEVATILIDGQHISQIGPDLELPPGTPQYDVAGLFLVPGLIDGFVQFDGDNDALYTRAGVTLVRDVGGDSGRLLSLRSNRDSVPGPSLITPGPQLGGYPPISPDASIFRDATEAERLMPILIADKVDFLSIAPNLPADAWARVVEVGKKHGLTTWGPASPQAGMGLDACIATGQAGFHYLDALLPSGVEWSIVQPLAFKKNIKKLVEADAGLVPLLRVTAQRIAPDLGLAADEQQYFRFLGEHYESWWQAEKQMRQSLAAKNETFIPTGQRVLGKQLKVLGMLEAAGAKLLPGSGSPHPWLMPGAGLVDELELWEQAGLEPSRLLFACTAGAAAILGQAEEHGRLKAGMLANIACFEADPRQAISNLRAPTMVVVRGQVNDRDDLADMEQDLLNRVAKQRAAQLLPLEVAKPTLPAGEVILEGFLETHARGTRVSAERWAVVREETGGLAFCGRVVTPPGGSFLGTELSVVQRVVDGRLLSFALTLEQEGHRLDLNAEWVAERLAISRRFNGQFVSTKYTMDRPVAIDVGSVTTALVLGQLKRTGRMPAIKFHKDFEAEVVPWVMEIATGGLHMVRTSTGGLVVAFADNGAPVSLKGKAGEQVTEAVFLKQSTFGGPGLPLAVKAVTYTAESK